LRSQRDPQRAQQSGTGKRCRVIVAYVHKAVTCVLSLKDPCRLHSAATFGGRDDAVGAAWPRPDRAQLRNGSPDRPPQAVCPASAPAVGSTHGDPTCIQRPRLARRCRDQWRWAFGTYTRTAPSANSPWPWHGPDTDHTVPTWPANQPPRPDATGSFTNTDKPPDQPRPNSWHGQSR
jgi:hypothetical protein